MDNRIIGIYRKMAEEYGPLNGKNSFLEAVEYTVKNLWIPVETALPDHGQIVLVHFESEDETGEMFSERRLDDPCTDENGFAVNLETERVTHWMPVPEI